MEILPSPGVPRFVVCDDHSISVEWDAKPHLFYRLCYKEYPQSWDEAKTIEIAQGEGKITTCKFDSLLPQSTYVIRLVAVSRDKTTESAPGPELIIDTAAGSCIPKPNKKKCTIS